MFAAASLQRALGFPALVVFCLAGSAWAQQVVEVSIQDYRYQPQAVKIKAGDTVKWINNEKRTSHSVLFPAEELESERLFPGESWQRRFAKPGHYSYGCGPHPEMSGVVDVVE